MGLFWKLYMLFFAIPFPMILYYAISGSQEAPAQSSLVLAYVYLALSVLLWALCLYLLLKTWIIGVFELHRAIGKLTSEGIPLQAAITDCVAVGPAGKQNFEPLEVTLSFQNMAGETVVERMAINDSKPYERRYETGKTINLRLDPDLKIPYLLPEDTRTRLKTGVLTLRVLGWLLLIVAIAAYYIFSYRYEGHNQYWTFLVFWHPLIICPVALLLSTIFNRSIIGKYFSPGKHDLRLKFYGRKTRARLRKASQTGLTINDQPQVLFELEYNDEQGKKYQVKLKKIVSLLNLDSTRQQEIEIFYLPEAPHTVAFAQDLE